MEASTFIITRSRIDTRHGSICIKTIFRPEYSFVEYSIHVIVQGSKTHITVDVGHSIELYKAAESLVIESDSSVVRIFGSTRIAVRSAVVGIYHAITIIVHSDILSGQFLIVHRIVCRHGEYFVPRVGKSCRKMSVVLSDGKSFRLLVCGTQHRVIVFENLVFSMSHIEVTPQTKTVVQCFIYTKFQFVSFRTHAS